MKSRLPLIAALILGRLFSAATAHAYGGWKTQTTMGALGEVLPFLAKGLLPLVIPFCICYWWIDKSEPYIGVAVGLFVLVDLAWVTQLMVMGEPGPAHFAADVVGWSVVLLPCFLLLKLLVAAFIQKRKEPAE